MSGNEIENGQLEVSKEIAGPGRAVDEKKERVIEDIANREEEEKKEEIHNEENSHLAEAADLPENEIEVNQASVIEKENEPQHSTRDTTSNIPSSDSLVTSHETTLLKDQKIKEILEMKSKLTSLIANIRNTKTLCEKYDSENQYLQDYIGTLMKSGELK